VKLKPAVVIAQSIQPIANNRAAERLEMGADLVGTPGQRPAFQPAHRLRTAENAPGGAGRLAVGDRRRPAAAADVDAPQRQIDHPRIVRRPTGDHRPIDFFDAIVGEQPAQPLQSLGMAPKDDAARGILVEPVGQFRRLGQAKPQFVEILAEMMRHAGPGMHRQSRRLVDDQNKRVAIKNRRRSERPVDLIRI